VFTVSTFGTHSSGLGVEDQCILENAVAPTYDHRTYGPTVPYYRLRRRRTLITQFARLHTTYSYCDGLWIQMILPLSSI